MSMGPTSFAQNGSDGIMQQNMLPESDISMAILNANNQV